MGRYPMECCIDKLSAFILLENGVNGSSNDIFKLTKIVSVVRDQKENG